MYNDKVIEMVNNIVDKAKKGEKTGNVECPYCGATINTHYSDDRYKCKGCGREYYILRYESEVEDGNN